MNTPTTSPPTTTLPAAGATTAPPARAGTVHTLSLVEVLCTGCGNDYWTSYRDEGPPLFADLAAAVEHTTDPSDPEHVWRWRPHPDIPGAWLTTCPSCRACESHGHRWSPWSACTCRGTIPGHAQTGCTPWRMCLRCLIADIGTPTDQTTLEAQR